MKAEPSETVLSIPALTVGGTLLTVVSAVSLPLPPSLSVTVTVTV